MLSLLAAIAMTATRDVRVDRDWLFHRDAPGAGETRYTGTDWEHVDLPHAARLEDDTAPAFHSFQGVVWYRKTFRPSRAWLGKRVALEVEAAMQAADVWVNGQHRLRHTGGYLPFEIDLSDDVAPGRDIQVDLRLDNRDDPSFPPGRPQNRLDFTYAGGLYRNVWLEVTDRCHIANVYVAPHVAGAGADVLVRPTLANVKDGQLVEVQLFDPAHKLVAAGEIMPSVMPSATLHLAHAELWDLDRPNLYQAVTRLVDGRRTVDRVTTTFGIRRLEFDHDRGARLNGRPIRLEGSNRHMAYPIVGNAASDEAQFREAKRLKGLGLNILRLAHYPQSPAFLDACDRLGILVIDPIPGWQFFRDTPGFRAHVLQDVRQTVERDRNHPCVAIFETCLNETYGAPDDFWIECSRTAHAAFDPGNFFTGGDSYGKHDTSRPIWDVPWTGWDDATFTRPALFPMQKGVDREYGDYEFGGEESTSRADRGAGEGALMLQAWNFIWSHNRNRGNAWSFGDLTWEAIDTYRGMNPTAPVSKSGLLDLFRLPKPVAYFYMSQGLSVPMVHIANRWTDRPSPTKVVVFSNCDTVALRLNGREIARAKPDHGPTTGYIGPKVADPLYWAHGSGDVLPPNEASQPVGGEPGALPFTGGNCVNLRHPPFTFMGVPYRSDRLEAVGYVEGRAVARDVVYTPGKPVRLALRLDLQGRPLTADGSDFVFAYAEVLDAHNQVVPDATARIRVSVHGAARCLGAAERAAVAGVAPFMVQATGTAGAVELTAVADGLPPVSVRFRTARN